MTKSQYIKQKTIINNLKDKIEQQFCLQETELLEEYYSDSINYLLSINFIIEADEHRDKNYVLKFNNLKYEIGFADCLKIIVWKTGKFDGPQPNDYYINNDIATDEWIFDTNKELIEFLNEELNKDCPEYLKDIQ